MRRHETGHKIKIKLTKPNAGYLKRLIKLVGLRNNGLREKMKNKQRNINRKIFVLKVWKLRQNGSLQTCYLFLKKKKCNMSRILNIKYVELVLRINLPDFRLVQTTLDNCLADSMIP